METHPLSQSHAFSTSRLSPMNGEAKTTKPNVLLALPCIGNPHLGSCWAAFQRASNDRMLVMMSPRNTSLLAFGFNQSWCDFANGTYDYFAMLHADHAPSDFWLDVMMEEMDNGGYGVMHAVAAIKDERGLTSTALGRRREPWGPLRRLTLHEIHKLPETFALEDCVRTFQDERYDCLMPNTGVMLVRREGFPFDKFTGFCISDRVVVDRNHRHGNAACPLNVTGICQHCVMADEARKSRCTCSQYSCQVEPEDWAFGRWCARNGVKVGGTRKVTTNHYGSACFNNSSGYGTWQRDEAAFNAGDPERMDVPVG